MRGTARVAVMRMKTRTTATESSQPILERDTSVYCRKSVVLRCSSCAAPSSACYRQLATVPFVSHKENAALVLLLLLLLLLLLDDMVLELCPLSVLLPLCHTANPPNTAMLYPKPQQ